MISKTIIFIFGFLAAIVAGQEATPESGRLLAKGSKGGKSGKSGKARRLLAKGTSGKGSKASKGGCGPDRFTGLQLCRPLWHSLPGHFCNSTVSIYSFYVSYAC